MKRITIYKKGIFLFPVILLLSLSVFSEEKNDIKPQIFSLKDVQEYAVRNSTNVINSNLDLKIAKKKVWETTATGLPQINGKVSYRDQLKIPTTLIPAKFMDPSAPDGEFFEMKFGTQHNATFDITVSQLVFNGTYIIGLQSAKIYKRISEESLIKSKIEVKALVSETYDMIIISESLRDILEKNFKNLKVLYNEVKEMNKSGFVEDTDVDQIKLSLDELKNKISNMERQIEISYRLLKFQMGMPLYDKITLSDNLTSLIERLKRSNIANESFLPEMNINFKIAETAVKSSNMLLKKEKSTFLPSLSAYFTYSKNAMRNDFNFLKKSGERWYPSIVAGLNLNFPIFSSGLRASRVQQSKMELFKAINTRNEVKRGLELNYSKTLSNYKNARNNSKTLGNSVKLAKRIYNKFLMKYKEGVSSSMDMIQAYNQYLSVEINYRNSLIQLSNAEIELEKVLNKM